MSDQIGRAIESAVLTSSPDALEDSTERSLGGDAAASAHTERDRKLAVMLAYGHLWHVNNEPAAPIALYEPERAAYQARRHLRDLLTTQERGEAINQVGFLIGRYSLFTEAPEPPLGAAAPLSNVSEPPNGDSSGALGKGVQPPDGTTERMERPPHDFLGRGIDWAKARRKAIRESRRGQSRPWIGSDVQDAFAAGAAHGLSVGLAAPFSPPLIQGQRLKQLVAEASATGSDELSGDAIERFAQLLLAEFAP